MANPDTPGAAKPAEPAMDLTKPVPAWRAWLGRGWGWMVVACVVLATSGAARAIQQQQIVREKSVFIPCPFPLAEIPLEFGDWVSNPKDDEKLDDKTIRITGSTDRIVRDYVNKYTGVRITALILYGPAEPVIPHTPEVCFPANGFAQDGAVSYTNIAVGNEKIPFRTATYGKQVGAEPIRVRSYFTFRMTDEWSPDVGAGKRFYRSNPGVFKIQIQRRLTPFERSALATEDDPKPGNGKGSKDAKDNLLTGIREPIELFLEPMLDYLEKRIDESTRPGSARPSVAQRDARNSRSVQGRVDDADRPRLAIGSGMN